jgi:hypothetical protein
MITDKEIEELNYLFKGYSESQIESLFNATTKEELRDRLGADAAKVTLPQMTLIYRIGPHWRDYFQNKDE